MASTATATAAEARIVKLNVASQRRLIEPDNDVPGAVAPGQILPDELLSVAGLGLDLTPEQRATLSREEVASIVEAGIRFEAVLEAGFAMQIAQERSLVAPHVTYLLHEVGEETRHQRIFIRLLEQLTPKAVNPIARQPFLTLQRLGIGQIIKRPALLYTLVLGGEEIPDLLQKLAAEHPDTDPFLREVNKYHRQEEARHLSFARTVLPEHYAKASFTDRFAVKYVAPLVIKGMFDMLVHPGVYAAVGLPKWKTWKEANRNPKRVAVRHQAIRPIVAALVAAGALKPGRIPGGWCRLAGVDKHGAALTP
ncbi:MAG: hypothetical protein QOH64_2324 [Acidimicrobiaceae bacterium]|jgi:hypothetical protein